MADSKPGRYPGMWGSAYTPPPWEFPRWAFLFVVIVGPVAVLIVCTLVYAEVGFPHGPKVFVGYYEVCDDRGKCGQVEGYIEDTSGIDNPLWVDLFREQSGAIWFTAIVLVGISFWLVPIYWKWLNPRRGLVWPRKPDLWTAKAHWIHSAMRSTAGLSTPDFTTRWVDFMADMDGRVHESSSEWSRLNAAGRLLYGFSQYEDAIWALETAQEMDRPREPIYFELSDEEREKDLSLVEEWHDTNIAYVQAHRKP